MTPHVLNVLNVLKSEKKPLLQICMLALSNSIFITFHITFQVDMASLYTLR